MVVLDSKQQMPETDTLCFYVNGKKIIDQEVDPRLTLAEYLRTKLLLKGTKIGCNEGGCGSCTVMVSSIELSTNHIRHRSVNSCLTPICKVHGCAVTTVEALEAMGKQHPVQERLSMAHGSQCGFCTPGFVMAMYTLLRNSSEPSVKEIDESLQGNLCRCTGYRPILEAFHSFSKNAVGGCCGGTASGPCCMQSGKEGAEEATSLADLKHCLAYDPSQEPIFPPELMVRRFDKETLVIRHRKMTWYRPQTLEELLQLKQRFPDGKLVAGNSEIGVEQRMKGTGYKTLIDTQSIEELVQVRREQNGIWIGSSISLSDVKDILTSEIEKNPDRCKNTLHAVVKMLHWFAGKHIRNTATIAGNIATASPISDLNPIWVACGAELQLTSQTGGKRTLLMDEGFFAGYRTTLIKPEEVIISIRIPYLAGNEYFYAYKQAQRREDDIAIVNAAFKLTLKEDTQVVQSIRIAFGGMAATTVMAIHTQQMLTGRQWNENIVETAIPLLMKDISLSPGTVGGMERFRQCLCLSFFLKFYMDVQLEIDNKKDVSCGQMEQDPVGRPLKMLSSKLQVSGSALYCDDVDVANVLCMHLVLSTKSNAEIAKIDPSEALEMPGVVDFVTAQDTPSKGSNMYASAMDQFAFANNKVVWYGQPIGGILALDPVTAAEAARRVNVMYQNEKRPVITIEEAIAANSYLDDEMTVNTNKNENFEAQPLDWSVCNQVLEGSVRIGGQEHFYFEPQCCAVIPGENDEVEVISSTQGLTSVQKCVSTVLGIPLHKVQVKTKRLGGGFGGKEEAASLIVAPAAIAAYKWKRPVRCTLERSDDMIICGTRHPFLINYKVGFQPNGELQALDLSMFCNGGCYRDLSPSVITKALFHADAGYRIPQCDIRGRPCRTNIQSATAFRGFGAPQVMLGTETIMEQISDELRLPPEKVREVNLYREGDVTYFGQKLTQCNQIRCWDECRGLAGFDDRRRQIDEFNKKNLYKKRGLSMIPTKFGVGFGQAAFLNQAGCLVMVYLDGSVLVSHSGTEMGQGLHTKVAQVAARCLRLPIDRIHIQETATDKVPNASPTAASMGSDLNCMAVKNACETLLQRLEPFMKENPKAGWESWVHEAYVNKVSLSTTGFFGTNLEQFDAHTFSGTLFHYFVYGAACSEVEIDCLTGDHRFLRADIVMDIGESLNPAIDIGQIEGAFIQGYGLYTMEELKCAPNGVWLTRGPGTYKIPSADDCPREFHVKLLKGSSNKDAIFRSKAVGEPPFFLGASAFFAIKDAIKSARKDHGVEGYFQFDSPATPERIRMTCPDSLTRAVPELPPKTEYTPWTVQL